MRHSTAIRRCFAALAVAYLGLHALTMTACNTTQGVGEDIEAAGDAISDTARDAKN